MSACDLRRFAILILAIMALFLSGNCYTLKHSDRKINVPKPEVKIFLNNPNKRTNTKKFSYHYREYFLWFGYVKLGHFPQTGNPVSSPFEEYLFDIHEMEKAKEYINVNVESKHSGFDMAFTGLGLLVTPLWFGSRSIEIEGEKVLD